MWRAGYRLLLWFAFPFVLARLWLRGRREPGYRQNITERFDYYPARPERPVIWLHAVSVGETRAAEPLLHALRETPGRSAAPHAQLHYCLTISAAIMTAREVGVAGHRMLLARMPLAGRMPTTPYFTASQVPARPDTLSKGSLSRCKARIFIQRRAAITHEIPGL